MSAKLAPQFVNVKWKYISAYLFTPGAAYCEWGGDGIEEEQTVEEQQANAVRNPVDEPTIAPKHPPVSCRDF